MSFAMKQYARIGTQASIQDASPHRLIQMLFRGALDRMASAKGAMENGDIARKGELIGKAISIVGGLRDAVIEDGGTLSSPLIPWNAGGLFVTSTLGVPTLLYAPFAIANWFAMVLDLLYAALGRFTPRADAAEIAQWRRDQNLLFHEGQLMTADALPPNTFAAERTP